MGSAEQIKTMDAWPAGASAELLPPCGSIHLHGGKAGVKDDSFDRFRKNFVEQGKKALPYFFARVNIAIVSCGFRPDVFWQELGNVTEVAIQTREDADSPQLVAVIDAAQCVWFTGGDQSRFRGLLHGSQLQTSLQRLLKRSGALGGAAAGASLLCAICPNFDEIFEGLDLLRGACVLTHLLRKGRQQRLAEMAQCFPGLWCLGLDEGAGLVISRCLEVTGWSPVLVMRSERGGAPSAVGAALLQPDFRGDLQDVEHRMQDLHSINWRPEEVTLPGAEIWKVGWTAPASALPSALADGPIDTVETNATFRPAEGHHFLCWQLPEEESQMLCFSSHCHLSITFDLEDLPLLCCLALVHRTDLGGSSVEIKINDYLVAGGYDVSERKASFGRFVASCFQVPMGTLRLGRNSLSVAGKAGYCLLSATLCDLGCELQAERRRCDSSMSTPRRGYLPRGPGSDGDSEEEHSVTLNIYDLGKSNTVQGLNGLLRPVGIGAFHCAVQVFGVEWSYGGKNEMLDPKATGVWGCMPRMADHTFREAVRMGSISLSEDETIELIYSLMQEWPVSDYDLLNKNCCHFCEELSLVLGLGPLPSRVKKLAGLGATLNESASLAADQVLQVASKVKSDIVGVGAVFSTSLAAAAVSVLDASKFQREEKA